MSNVSLKKCVVGWSLLVAVTAWSQSSASSSTTASESIRLGEPTIVVHWAGTPRIAADTNSAKLGEIAALPESVGLWDQTLDKLSQAPWRLKGLAVDTNAASHLRPLLNDLLRHEFLFELAGASNQAAGCILAAQLDNQLSSVWETNLAVAVKALTGRDPVPATTVRSGWRLPPANRSKAKSNPPSKPGGKDEHAWEATPNGAIELPYIAFTRSDGWTIVGLAQNEAMFGELAKRAVSSAKSGFSNTNLWVEAVLDLERLASQFSLSSDLFTTYPKVHLDVRGKSGNVQTEATLLFPASLGIDLAPWDVPTNLIGEPLVSFTAIRGLNRILPASRLWRTLQLPSPDQAFAWSLGAQPMLSYFAASASQTTNFVQHASELILHNGRGWRSKDLKSGFKASTEHDGVEWQGLPYAWPFLRSFSTNGQSYILGGMFSYVPPRHPLSSEFCSKALRTDDLLFYGWEKTGERIEHWLFMGQFIRYVSGLAQLPFQSKSLLWLKSLEPKVGDSLTQILLSQPNEMKLTRSASVGLTGIELQLLADWLESPEFPRGLHTTLAQPEPQK